MVYFHGDRFESECNSRHFDGFPWLMDTGDKQRFQGALAKLARLMPARDGGRGRLLTFMHRNKTIKSHTFCWIASSYGTWLLEHASSLGPECRKTAQRLLYVMSLLQDKAVARAQVPIIKSAVVRAICDVEENFPASECDVKLHNLIHLADRLLDLGPGWTTAMWRWESLWNRYCSSDSSIDYT